MGCPSRHQRHRCPEHQLALPELLERTAGGPMRRIVTPKLAIGARAIDKEQLSHLSGGQTSVPVDAAENLRALRDQLEWKLPALARIQPVP